MKAIITGSSNGLGLAIAKYFAANGISVALTARKEERLQEVLAEVKEMAKDAEVIGSVVDFGSSNMVNQFVNEIHQQWGNIDILINNAGIYREDTILDDIEDSLQLNLNVNLFSSVRMNQAIQDKINPGGFIINMVSIAARDLRHDAASYTISKVALKAYTDMLREAFRPKNIKVLGLYPGAMNTRSWDGEDVDLGKMIQTSDICLSIMNALQMSGNVAIEDIIINPVEPI